MLRVGVLALQGDIEEHVEAICAAFKELGARGETRLVKRPEHFQGLNALILPGGESTTLSKLLLNHRLVERVVELAEQGCGVMGTCAGLILLAKEGCEQIQRTGQLLLGLMDIKVRRNAFGRQRESFEVQLEIEGVGRYPCVFIRAPAVERVWGEVRILGRFEDKIVAVEQGSILGLAFHPELTGDSRVHCYFLEKLIP